MSPLSKIIHAFTPEKVRLAWLRRVTKRGYERDIALVRKARSFNKIAELESSAQFEMALQQELEDSYLTSKLRQTARRLRVPIPRIRSSDCSETDFWYKGSQTGDWYLTDNGIRFLRREIRQEVKDRREKYSCLIVWITALTGLIGAITGLIAVLQRKG